ncbi:MAG: sigma-70 family RNA polymerase sigma factor [Bacilli bacterium]|nr:sigma-70 family RNA polymerase sigma factor [Bacilli bacterium]
MAKTLLKRLKSGDESAFDEIYLTSKKQIFFTIRAIVKDEMACEDLMQEVYEDFLSYFSSLKDDTEVIAFLTTSAKNKAINYYNRHIREEEYALSNVPNSSSKDSYMDTGLLAKIKTILTDKEFEVFTMRVLGEYSFKEMSEMLDIPLGTLTWQFQEARKKLLDVFKEDK